MCLHLIVQNLSVLSEKLKNDMTLSLKNLCKFSVLVIKTKLDRRMYPIMVFDKQEMH